MSQPHIRISKDDPRGSLWPACLTLLAICVLVLIVLFSWRFQLDSLPAGESATGKVLETRIAVNSTRDLNSGGEILYRIDALVRFERDGQIVERWMPSVETDRSQPLLELRVRRGHGHCKVMWSSTNPENLHCSFPL